MSSFRLLTSLNRNNRLPKQQTNLTFTFVNNQLKKLHYKTNCFKSTSGIPEQLAMDADATLDQAVRSKLKCILDAGLCSVMPSVLIHEKVQYDGENLTVLGKSYPLRENVYLVGFGKAVASMAQALVELLGPRLVRGVLSVPTRPTGQSNTGEDVLPGFREIRELEAQQLMTLGRSRILECLEGARNNQPDDAACTNTERILELVRSLGPSDSLLVLVSGGGSALLSKPKPPLRFEEKRELCRRLQNAGASIAELNVVRKQLSEVKGGGLARAAYPADVIALILSDVVGDPVDIIASGPTCPLPPGNQEEAIRILEKYNIDLHSTFSEEVITELFEKTTNDNVALLGENGQFNFVNNIIIGNNTTALEASAKTAKSFDLEPIILSNTVEGNVKDISVAYAQLIKNVCCILDGNFSSKEDFIKEIFKHNIEVLNINQENLEKVYETLVSLRKGKGVLLLTGGEPTVTIKGDGKGGRNQELALQFSLDWLNKIAKYPELARYHVQIFCIGTDGQDGPTDAAGAFGQPGIRPKIMQMIQELLEKKKITARAKLLDIDSEIEEMKQMLPENILKRNDSYTFYSKFEKGKNHLKIGLTGTNVMDLHYIYVRKRDCECDFVC